MSSPVDVREGRARFRALHEGPEPLLLVNAWDVGTAKVLAMLGFAALATTSAGHAATLGRPDGEVTRDEAMAHAAGLVAATELPVNADLENGYAADPDGVAEIVRAAAEVGLAGCSIEDWDRDGHRLYEVGPAAERVAAAAEAAMASGLVLTARAENYLHGAPDLADTIRRLQAYQEAGAEVLYAPGLTDAEDIAVVVRSVDRPVNVLARPGVPPVAELGRLGVRRVSVGGAFALVAYDALAEAARELRDQGSYGYLDRAARAVPLRAAFDRTNDAN